METEKNAWEAPKITVLPCGEQDLAGAAALPDGELLALLHRLRQASASSATGSV